jgi:hypothetical protein
MLQLTIHELRSQFASYLSCDTMCDIISTVIICQQIIDPDSLPRVRFSDKNIKGRRDLPVWSEEDGPATPDDVPAAAEMKASANRGPCATSYFAGQAYLIR